MAIALENKVAKALLKQKNGFIENVEKSLVRYESACSEEEESIWSREFNYWNTLVGAYTEILGADYQRKFDSIKKKKMEGKQAA